MTATPPRRLAHRLSAAFVRTAEPGFYCDGHGLNLRVDPSGARRPHSIARCPADVAIDRGKRHCSFDPEETPHTMTRPTSGGQGYHVVRS